MRLLVVILFSVLAFGQGTVMPILGSTGAPAGGGGNPAVTDLGGTCASGGTVTLSFSAVGSGSQILVFGALYSFPSPLVWTTLKASDGNNISDDNHKWIAATNTMYMQWGHYLSPGGITSITGTFAGGNPGCISALAVTNLNASPFDFTDSAINESAAGTFTSQTISPTGSQNEILVMGAFEVFSPFMASTTSGWVDAGQGNAGATFFVGISYKLATSTTGTYFDSGTNGSLAALDLFTASYKK